MILTKEGTVCFWVVEEARKNTNKYRDARQSWMNLSRNFKKTTGDSKKIPCKKTAKFKLDDVIRNPK